VPILWAAVSAQSQPPVFRARTDLVRIDVVVVDAAGQVVEGLTERDFQVLDRGRPQRIAAFEEVSHARTAPALPLDLRMDVADNATLAPDRLIIVVLDDLHFQGKTAAVKAMARRVVSDIGPRAAIALVTTSRTFGVEPTEDRAVLLTEIDRFLDRFDPEMRRLARGAQMPDPPVLRNALGAPVRERGPSAPLNQFFGDMAAFKVIQDAAKKLESGAGRRNAFVWISGGVNTPGADFNGCIEPAADGWYCNALGGVLEALRKSNATAYAVHTGDRSAAMLRAVTDASGGFVMDAGEFDRGVDRLIADLDHYYLIGFAPDDARDREFHPLEVRVNRPGVTVRSRRGYKPGELSRPRRKGSALAVLSSGVLPVPDLPLRMYAAPAGRTSRGVTRLMIALELREPRGRIAEADGHIRDVLRYEVWAVDLKKKKAVANVAREARLVLDPAETAAAAGDPLPVQVHTSLALEPGRYQLRASVTSRKTGAGGSIFFEIDVVDPRKPDLGVGPIVIGYAGGPRVPIVRGGAGIGLLPLHPTLDREFARADTLRVVCDLTGVLARPADVVVDLLEGHAGEGARLLTTRATAAARRVDLDVPLEGLAPGAYRIRVGAADGATSAVREVGFQVGFGVRSPR
jgi:VWFA-related protein